MERKDPPREQIGQSHTEKLIDDVHRGLQVLIRLMEDESSDFREGPFKEKLLELDHQSRQFLGLIHKNRMASPSVQDGIIGPDRHMTGHRFIQQLDLLIEQNLDNHKFGVCELVRALGMSRSKIHRKLTSLTRQSANCYIRNYRLHRAARMLRESSSNVSDIAYQVGFGSQTYFSKCFREIFMMSPTAYRKTFDKGRKCVQMRDDVKQ